MLNDDQLAHYHREGYLILRGAIAEASPARVV